MAESKVIDAATQIGSVGLKVADLKRSAEFYVGALGFRILEETEGRLVLGAADGYASSGPLVVLVERPGAEPRPPRTLGLYHFAILVPSRPALARSLRRLAETKTRLHGAADHLVSEALYLNDPDGNGIEIYRDRPSSGWKWKDGEVQMDTLSLDFGKLLDELNPDEGPWAGLEPTTRIGHIHLHVPDLRTASKFYSDTLGFSTVARLPGALFVSAGGYHHHVGLNNWAGRNVAPSDAAGLDFFEIRLPSAVGLGAVAERILEHGIALDEEYDGILAHDPFKNRVVLTSGK